MDVTTPPNSSFVLHLGALDFTSKLTGQPTYGGAVHFGYLTGIGLVEDKTSNRVTQTASRCPADNEETSVEIYSFS